MGFVDIVKAVFVPAVIAAALYGLLAYIVWPLYRNHRARYSQYLPLDSLSSQTSNLRSRLGSAIERVMLPAHVRWRRDLVDQQWARSGSGDELFGEEEGESMVGFDVNRSEGIRREAREEIDSDRRLSRDLEEGFRDSEEEDSGDDRRR